MDQNTAATGKTHIAIDDSWKEALQEEFTKTYFQEIRGFLKQAKADGKQIFPPGPEIFNAFNTTPYHKVKVVIIGQDPYHGPGQAHGLSFSVKKGVNPPPSLKNIYKELHEDVGFQFPGHGDLSHWAEQGVLMLNAILTVEARNAASHRNIGWEHFTDAAIRKISEEKEGVVFLLWGKFAQAKAELIDQQKHHVLMAPHPSPYSASSGFFGCRHFSKANELLQQQGKNPIDWQLE